MPKKLQSRKLPVAVALIGASAMYALWQSSLGAQTPVAPIIQNNHAPSATTVPRVSQTSGIYRDGSYIGTAINAYYGTVQVQALIQSGKIANVQFLQHPSDRNTSIEINNYAMPILIKEAISAQSAQVDTASGATFTSEAFKQSLASALAQAKN